MDFFPRGQSQIIVDKLGRVEMLIGVIDSRKILFVVEDGKVKRTSTPENPWFPISHRILFGVYAQANAIVKDHAKTSEKKINPLQHVRQPQIKETEIKKPNWTRDFKSYGIIIDINGSMQISRWIKKNGNYHKIWQPVADLNTAIRMQDHIIASYLERKEKLEREPDLYSLPLGNLLKKLPIVLPYIEMRREILASARVKMEKCLLEAGERIQSLSEDRNLKTDDISQIISYLTNSWLVPYWQKAQLMVLFLNQAKARHWEKKINQCHEILKAAVGQTIQTIGQAVKISEIDPVYTLGRISQLDKTNEVLVMVKEILPDKCQLIKRQLSGCLIRLKAFLIVSKLVLSEKQISVENACGLCRVLNHLPTPSGILSFTC